MIKIMEIDHHIGAAMSGLVADAITLIDNARVNAANHLFNYGEPMSVSFHFTAFLVDRECCSIIIGDYAFLW